MKRNNLWSMCFIGMAWTTHVDATWVFALTPKDVRSQGETGQVSFRTVEPLVNPAGCNNIDYYGILPGNNPNSRLALLLSAYLMRKRIDIYIHNTGCDMWGRPRVTDVRIRD